MNQLMNQEHEARIDALLKEMTIEEKIGQMNQLSPSIVGGFDLPFEELIEMVTEGRISHEEFGQIMAKAEMDYHEEEIRSGKIGSFLIKDPKKANALQKIAVEESRLGIPLIFGFDVIHGFRTVFPIPLAETCSWDEEIFEKTARIAAREARAQGIHWTFAPMVDIARDARWGRIAESPGEDPYLASQFAKAKVRGFQGKSLSEKESIASCLKHFVGYGGAEAGRDYNTVSIAPNQLFNTYLPPVKAAVDEGAATVMAAFNDINGLPCTINRYLLTDLLKEQYQFHGFVVSDANAIDDCIRHGVAKDLGEASFKACKAGMDMDMNSHAYSGYLAEQVKEGAVSMQELDEAVRRILRVKLSLGLFENPYVDVNLEQDTTSILKESLETALECAVKSIVLLKNDNQVLPLRKNQKIGLIGELANLPAEVLGSWALGGREEDCISIYQGLKNAGFQPVYEKVCGVTSPFRKGELDRVIEEVDVIVAVVGETSSMSGEAASRSDLSLPGEQQMMLEAAVASKKPVVVVLMNGRPLALPWVAEHADAILESWQLGIQMGNAVAKVLLGEYNPSGKLCVTFPNTVGQCPMYYNHPSTGRPGGKSKFSSKFMDAPIEPLYPFGFGLSYTRFAYRDLVVEQKEEELFIEVEVQNEGLYEGTEIVQLYIQDVTASMIRPVKELKGFRKVTLVVGERSKVRLIVKKSDLGFYTNEMDYITEDGLFRIYVGTNSRDTLQAEIQVQF